MCALQYIINSMIGNQTNSYVVVIELAPLDLLYLHDTAKPISGHTTS